MNNLTNLKNLELVSYLQCGANGKHQGFFAEGLIFFDKYGNQTSTEVEQKIKCAECGNPSVKRTRYSYKKFIQECLKEDPKEFIFLETFSSKDGVEINKYYIPLDSQKGFIVKSSDADVLRLDKFYDLAEDVERHPNEEDLKLFSDNLDILFPEQ